MRSSARMVRLMTAEDAFSAKVVAARLGVEGIVWELRGGIDGPYPIGPVHVFVDESDLPEAQALLAATSPLESEHDEWEPVDRSGPDRRSVLLGAGVVALLALASAELVRLLSA